MAEFVGKLTGVLKDMLGRDVALPRVLCSDRGPGFFQTSTGHIVGDYKEACREHGFRPMAGDDASGQPPDIPDVLLHETAVAWARSFFRKHPLKKGGGIDAMREEFKGVLRECAKHINGNFIRSMICVGRSLLAWQSWSMKLRASACAIKTVPSCVEVRNEFHNALLVRRLRGLRPRGRGMKWHYSEA